MTTIVPPSTTHESALGQAIDGINNHLYVPAGAVSRPPNIRRGVTTVWSKPYDTPATDAATRAADLSHEAVALAVAALPPARDEVAALHHMQCVVDQQIVGSTCLRLQQAFFRGAADNVMTLGQLGTAPLPTALALAQRTGLTTALSAGDKWIAPFFRKLAGTTFGDAAACAIVARRAGPALARVEKVAVVNAPPLASPWTGSAGDARTFLGSLAVQALAKLGLGARPGGRRDVWLVGDGHGPEVAAALTQDTGLTPLLAADDPANGVHLSCASLFVAIARGVERAVATGDPVDIAAWTASISGHAGAILVRCRPDAVPVVGGWSANLDGEQP